MAYGDSTAGRSEVMADLVARGLTGGGAKASTPIFRPDRILQDNEEITGPDWTLQALWTSGHIGNHLCFAWENALFTRRSCDGLGQFTGFATGRGFDAIHGLLQPTSGTR